MESQITPSAAVVRAFASSRQQLQNALDHLNNQEAFLADNIEQFESASVDEYNQAVELNEQLQVTIDNNQGIIDSLKLEISSLKEVQSEFEIRALDAEKQTARTERLRLAEKAVSSDNLKQLNELKSLNPIRLKADNKEKTKLLDKQRIEMRTLREEITDLKRENVRLEKEAGRLLDMLGRADNDINRLKNSNSISDLHKNILDKPFTSPDEPNKPFYAYLLTDAGNQTNQKHLINDLDWKIHVMNCYGEGVAVMYTEWLYPQMPPCKVGESVPYSLIEALMDFGMTAVNFSHGHLVDRVIWAKSVMLSSIGLPDKQLSILEGAGMFELHQLMSMHQTELVKIKGISDKSAQSIMECANKYVADNYRAEEREAA